MDISRRLICLVCFIFLEFQLSYAQPVIAYPDNSVDLAGFIANGMPAVDQVWSPKEYENAFQLLSKIYEMDKYSLPRYKSKASGRLFDQLVAKENLDYLVDTNFTLKDRVIALERYAYIPARLMMFYLEEKASVERYGAEVLAIMEFSVQLSNHAVLLIKELKASIGAQANSDNFIKGYENILTAHESSIEEIINIFEIKYERFDEQVVNNYSQSMIDFLPKVWQKMRKDRQGNLMQRVKTLAKSHPRKKLKKQMNRLCKKLKKIK